MRRVLASPGCYVQGKGEIEKLAEYSATLGQAGAYLLVDPFILKTRRPQLESSFLSAKAHFVMAEFGGECCMCEVERHRAALNGCDVIFGIGGGKTQDCAKAVAYYARLPVVIVPTAASSDAPCSRLAVLYTPEGAFERYLPLRTNPALVLVDTAVVAAAPVRLLRAGIGDALATAYEAEACVASNAENLLGGHATQAALVLAVRCREVLLRDGRQALADVDRGQCTAAVENVIEANTYLSAVGFESGGLAAAHALHNGLMLLPGARAMMHGERVAFCLPTQLLLEQRPQQEIYELLCFCRALGLPVTFAEAGLAGVQDAQLEQAAQAACEDIGMSHMPCTVTFAMVVQAMRQIEEWALSLAEKADTEEK